MKCFYHRGDLDGRCSGAIVKLKFPECEMIGVDYQDKFNQITCEPGEEIFVLDFWFPPEIMKRLNNTGVLHWFDHHETSLKWATKEKFLASGSQILEIGRAGCELTWGALFPKVKLPEAVFLLGRYDVWDHEDPRVLPFQWGMRNYDDTSPTNIGFREQIFTEPVDELVKIGQILLNFQAKQDAIYARGMAYDTKFEGYRAVVMNKAFANSKAFDAVYDHNKHDIMVMFGVKPDGYKYTLFSNKPEIDVSKIAEKYNGGGHKGAAGFYSNRLIV